MAEDDFYTDEDLRMMHEADEPDYYYCTCCNHTQAERDMGNSCDCCGLVGVMDEGYF